tara:strand:+ start:1224 stop:2504 length:1281 start_codon:yes stop_codon:yes gene_type:complete
MALQPDLHANQSMLIYIDSEDSETDAVIGDLAGPSSDFILDLEEPIICPENQLMLASMYSCSIPYSFYDIRDNVNDKIQLSIFNSGTGLSQAFDIDFGASLPQKPYYYFINSHGNYNVTSLSVQVNLIFTTLIRPSLIAGGFAGATSEVLLDYIDTKQRYTFTLLNFPVGLIPQIQQQGEGYMDSEIGLPEDDNLIRVFTYDVASGNYFYQLPNVVDITGSTHGLFLRTNLSSDSTIASDTGRSTDILAHIPITASQGEIIHSPPQSNLHKSRVKVKALNHIHILIRDERNRPMNFNGLHTHIVILIDFIYDRKKIIPNDSFRRQKEVFQHRIQGRADELATQGFKNLQFRSHSRQVKTHEPDLVQQPHAPNVEITQGEEEQEEEEDIENDEEDEEKMENTENIEVEQSGNDSNETDANTLVKDTI